MKDDAVDQALADWGRADFADAAAVARLAAHGAALGQRGRRRWWPLLAGGGAVAASVAAALMFAAPQTLQAPAPMMAAVQETGDADESFALLFTPTLEEEMFL